MNINEKLAHWQGKCYHVSDWGQTICKYCGRTNDPRYFDFDTINPDYLNDDAAAMSLLDTLVEKGYEYELQAHYCYNAERVMYRLKLERIKTGEVLWVDDKKYFITRREAVVTVCLELIKKEASHDV